MAKLTRDDVLKLARLARLRLSEEEVSRFQNEISAILRYVDQLQAVSLDGIEPTYQVTGLQNVMRADDVVDYGVTPAQLLENAPGVENNQLKTKRMIA